MGVGRAERTGLVDLARDTSRAKSRLVFCGQGLRILLAGLLEFYSGVRAGVGPNAVISIFYGFFENPINLNHQKRKDVPIAQIKNNKIERVESTGPSV